MRSVFLVSVLLLGVASAQNLFFGCAMKPATSSVSTTGTGYVACFYGLGDAAGSTENWLSCQYTYTGLTSNGFAAHWHVGTPSTASGNVTFVYYPPSGTAGNAYTQWNAATAGTSWLPQYGFNFPDQVASCASGVGCYFNLHTSMYMGGELRCQGTPFSMGKVSQAFAPLVVAPVTGGGTGTGSFSIWYGLLQDGTSAWAYSVNFQGMTEAPFMSHIHLGNNATELGSGDIAVWFNISTHNPLAASGVFSSVSLEAVAAAVPIPYATVTAKYNMPFGVANNYTYVNLHTHNYMAGELRGNFGLTVSGSSFVTPVASLVVALIALVKIVA